MTLLAGMPASPAPAATPPASPQRGLQEFPEPWPGLPALPDCRDRAAMVRETVKAYRYPTNGNRKNVE